MSYRDELDAARLQIEALQAELAQLRGNAVQWTPEEVVSLREALYSARLEATRERRAREELAQAMSARPDVTQVQEELRLAREMARNLMREVTEAQKRASALEGSLRAEITEANEEVERVRNHCQVLESLVKQAPPELHGRIAALEDALAEMRRHMKEQRSAASLERDLTAMREELESRTLALRMWGRTYEARLARATRPTPKLGDTEVAAFRTTFSPAAFAASAERASLAQELLLRIAASIYDGRPFTPEALAPAVLLLRAAGHPLVDAGYGRYSSAGLSLEASGERLVITLGSDRYEISAGTP